MVAALSWRPLALPSVMLLRHSSSFTDRCSSILPRRLLQCYHHPRRLLRCCRHPHRAPYPVVILIDPPIPSSSTTIVLIVNLLLPSSICCRYQSAAGVADLPSPICSRRHPSTFPPPSLNLSSSRLSPARLRLPRLPPLPRLSVSPYLSPAKVPPLPRLFPEFDMNLGIM
ncbi:hypothetical protein ACLOJK_041746 [Asimina triloba]